MFEEGKIASTFIPEANAVVFHGSCLDLMKEIPDNYVKLVVTSPPYNIGKEYERKLKLEEYLIQQEKVIRESYRILHPEGSICWQVGNYVNKGEIIPLDTVLYPIFNKLGLKLRNRIIWNFEHGLHCSKRLSGRYETINWFTKEDSYTFNLDPVRIPQKYPGKNILKVRRRGNTHAILLGKTQEMCGQYRM